MWTSRLLKIMAVGMFLGGFGSSWGFAEEQEKPKPKGKPEKPPVVREKEAPEDFVPPEKPPRPDWDRPERPEAKAPPEKAPWKNGERPIWGEKPRPPFPPREPKPEEADRPDLPPGPEGEPRWIPGEGPRRPGMPDLPPMGPKEVPPGMPGGPRRDWQWLQRTDPEMFQLLQADAEMEEQSQRLAMQYRHAPDAEKERLRKELEELVSKHFEVRQQRRLLEVRRLEEELKRLRETLEKRQAAREEIVKNRIRELLGPEDLLRF